MIVILTYVQNAGYKAYHIKRSKYFTAGGPNRDKNTFVTRRKTARIYDKLFLYNLRKYKNQYIKIRVYIEVFIVIYLCGLQSIDLYKHACT